MVWEDQPLPQGIEAIDQHVEELEEQREVFSYRCMRARREAQRIFSYDKLEYRRRQDEVVYYERKIAKIDERLSLLREKRQQ